MKTINFQGKNYPARTFTMTSEETGEVTYTIADETLSEANQESPVDCIIDESIYFYVEKGVLDLSAEEICEKHLDIKFEFISEE